MSQRDNVNSVAAQSNNGVIQDWRPEDTRFWQQTGQRIANHLDFYSMFIARILRMDVI